MTIVKTKFNKHQIYDILKNYNRMVKEIQRINFELKSTDFKGTAQYGMSAALPTGKGTVGKALENEVIRRNSMAKRMYEYSDKINFLNERIPKIINEMDIMVLDCMLDGMSLTAISLHLRLSRKQVHLIRDNIVNLLAE